VARQHFLAIVRVQQGFFFGDGMPVKQAAQRNVRRLHSESTTTPHDGCEILKAAGAKCRSHRRADDKNLDNWHASILVRAMQKALRSDATKRFCQPSAHSRPIFDSRQ
tara:strand:+ start:719 stop:1042 length:324 start_codon:yes stop_codon:yes gene_type:complete